MPQGFDAYRKWLGIPPAEQPPNHYRLLGIGPFEDDPDVIESAADQRMSHLRTFQAGANSALSQKLLNEVAAAKICLLSPTAKAAYDAQLRRQLDAAKGERGLPKPKVLSESRDATRSAEASVDSYSPILVVDHQEARSRKTTTRHEARQSTVVWLAASAVAVLVLGVTVYAVFGPTRPSPKPASPAAVAVRSEKPQRKTTAPTENSPRASRTIRLRQRLMRSRTTPIPAARPGPSPRSAPNKPTRIKRRGQPICTCR